MGIHLEVTAVRYRVLSQYRSELMGIAMLWVMLFHATDLDMGHDILQAMRRMGFGGVDIFLPDNVNVQIKSTSIFGGVEDKRRLAELPGAPTVYVSAICLFGGVDIK